MNSAADRIAAAAFLLLPVMLCVWLVSGTLVPVGLAALCAVILYPLLPRLQARLGRLRAVGPSVLLGGASVLLLLPVTFVAFMSVHTLRQTAHQDVGELRASVEQALTGQLERLAGLAQRAGVSVDVQNLRERAVTVVQASAKAMGTWLGRAVASTPDLLVSVFLFFFALYVFLHSGPRAVAWLGSIMPFSQEETTELFDQVRKAVRGVVLGSILTGLLQSGLCLAALVVFKVPGAFVWSVMAFLLSFLPMIGTTPVTLGAAAYLALSEQWGMAVGMGVAAVIIGSADNVVRPFVQGSESKLHPLFALMAIFGGLEVLGPAGIFLGPVVAAVARWGVETYARWRGPRIAGSVS